MTAAKRRGKVALHLGANAADIDRSDILLELEMLAFPFAFERQPLDPLHEGLAAQIKAGA